MTRETVWWETPARAATSDMTSARGAPSGCTVSPSLARCAGVTPAPDGAGADPYGRSAPSARAGCAPLVVDVEGDGQQQHQALDHRLDGLVDAHQLHAVAHDADEQATDD